MTSRAILPLAGLGDSLAGSYTRQMATRPRPETVALPGAQPEPQPESYRAVLRSFGDIAEALSADVPLDTLLHLVASRICSLFEIRRCSVYLREDDSNLFRGQVGHATGKDIDALVKRLVAGVEADRFTQEILATKQPVLVRDALADPRPIRSTMRAWKIRAMLGVPMIASGEVIGICFLDNEEEPHLFTPAHQEIASTFADLAAVAITQGQLTARLRESITTVGRQNDLLRRSAAVEDRLTKLVLEGANLREIAAVVCDLTGKPCSIHDGAGRRIAAASPPEASDVVPSLLDAEHRDVPAVQEALEALGSTRAAVVGPLAHIGLSHRFLVAPVRARNDRWGHLVVMEYGRRFAVLDTIVAGRAATIIALELASERRAAAAQGEALEALGSDLLRGGFNEAALERRAEFLGVDLNTPHVLCLLAATGPGREESQTARGVAAAFRAAAPGATLLTTAVAEGIVAILELPDELSQRAAIGGVKELLVDVCRRLSPAGHLAAGISSICRRPGDYARAYTEAQQVLGVVDAFAREGQPPVLSSDDLGVGRFFLAAADREDARRFAVDLLAGLLEGEDGRGADLLLTLRAFFEGSRSVRRSALRLGVHENTIRYRLARIEETTGLDLSGNADDQLAAQLALLVLELDGRLSAPL